MNTIKIVFLEVNTLGADVDLSEFKELGEVVTYPISDPEKNAERIGDADVVVVNKIPVNEALLKNAPNVRLVCLTATGTNNVDFGYTQSHDIAVCNVKGYSTESVVQHTFSLCFYLLEKMNYYDNFVKSGKYAHNDVFSHFLNDFHELSGKTWGIIGLGTIGKRVAEAAKVFGCNVIYYSTSGIHDDDTFTRVSLDELLSKSDIISIHAPLNDKTRGLIGSKELCCMKKDAIILNLGRGGIIDEAALAEALLNDSIGGAGLDVLVREPIEPSNPLLAISDSSKLVITPHIAWATVEARKRCASEVYKNIKSFYNGGTRNRV